MTEKRPKILHFMPENFVHGGIETYLACMLPELKQQNHYDIAAVVTQDSQLYHSLKQSGITTHGISFPLRQKSIWRSLWINPWMRSIDLSVYWKLLPILRKEKPDLVHIHNGRIEQALIRMAGFPVVYTYHGYGGPYSIESAPTPALKTLYKLIRPLFRLLTPFLTGMTVVSHYERQRLYREEFLPEGFECETIHNGLPILSIQKEFRHLDKKTLRQEFGLPQQARIVSCFCRLREDRNPLAVLRIARRILTDKRLKHPTYFLVAGEGKLAGEFQKAFSEDPILSKHGSYLGFRHDVHRLIRASDITLSTSLQEGFGLRVLESLLLGRPCIAYAAGGIPEVMSLPEAWEWLVFVGSEDAFVERLIRTINMDSDELDRLAPILEAHAHYFDMTHHIQKIASFYEKTFKKLANRHSEKPRESTISPFPSFRKQIN